MKSPKHPVVSQSGECWRPVCILTGCLLSVLVGGCATPAQTAGAIIAGTTVLGAQTPSDEIEQIYYLGVFDPLEQLPPSIYRVTVRGQSSFLNQSKFASGWVPAPLIDSLSSQAADTGIGSSVFTEAGTGITNAAALRTGRRLVLFGPEGFREAPKDHRLVIVMGGDPAAYFEAVDLALGDMGGAKARQEGEATLRRISEAFVASETVDRSLEQLLLKVRTQSQPPTQ